MKLLLIAESGDYLFNLYTHEIKQAKFVFSETGNAVVEEYFPPESDSPEITIWERLEYLIIPDINDVHPDLWKEEEIDWDQI